MAEIGRFVEIATIEENEIELNIEALEELFNGPDTRNVQVAVISVLGQINGKKSKCLGKMMQYLQEEDETDLDELTASQVATFGNDELINKPSIVTWSKPYFVTKGSKQKVAIFLLDVKGNFNGNNDMNYIALSGLCTFISSSVLYLSYGKFEDFSMNHIECIALEGIRHFGGKLSIIHQRIRVICKNWNATDEFFYGDKTGGKYADYLKNKTKNPIFDAFEDFTFFFLPDENQKQYPDYFQKLLSTTLEDTYVVPKKLGSAVKAPVIISQLKKYVEEMDPEDNSNCSLKDFFSSKNAERKCDKVPEKESIQEKANSREASGSAKSRKSDTLPKEKERKPVKPKRSSLNRNKPHSQKDYGGPSKEESSGLAFTDTGNITEANVTLPKEITEEQFNLQENKYPAEFGQSDVLTTNTFTNSDEKFDLQTFLQANISQTTNNFKQSEELKQTLPTVTPQQILESLDQKMHKTEPKDQENGTAEAHCLIEKVVDKETKEVVVEQTKPFALSHSIKEKKYKELASRNENQMHTNLRTQSAIQRNQILLSHGSTPITNQAKRNGLMNPKMRIPYVPPQTQGNNTTAEITKRNTYVQNQIRLHILTVFKNTPLQSTTSTDDILKKVEQNIGSRLQNIKGELEKERKTVNLAITAVTLYIEEMENAFKDTFSFSTADFASLHQNCYQKANSFSDRLDYLNDPVKKKIGEACRIFNDFNNSNLRQQDTLVKKAIQGVREIYVKKISSNGAADTLEERHREIKKSILEAANKSCLINKSAWANKWLANLDSELESLFEQTKLALFKEKVETAVSASLMYYKSEMSRTLHSGVINELTQFDSLHETKYSEALARYKNNTGRDVQNIVNQGEKKLVAELTKHCLILRTEKTLAMQNNASPPRKSNFQSQEVLRKPFFEQNIQNETRVDSPGHCCIGIHLSFSKIVVTALLNNEVTEIFRKEDPCIGFNGKVFMQEGKSLLDNFADYSLGFWCRKMVNTKLIFQNPIGTRISLNWDGLKTFRAEELLSILLFQIKQECETFLGGAITTCTIAVPSYFHSVEVQAVLHAASITGFTSTKVMREICSAGIGTWFFKDGTKKYPTEFVLIDTTGENWEAAYYNYNQNLNPNILSGDLYVKTRFKTIYNRNQVRLTNILGDIIKQISERHHLNVGIIADEDVYNEITPNIHICKNIKLTFFQVSKKSIKRGIALVAALMGKCSVAQSIWDNQHPISSFQERYELDTLLNNPWTAPISSKNSSHNVQGKNLEESNIPEYKRNLHAYITTPQIFEDAQSTLLHIGKLISDVSFNRNAASKIRLLIEQAYEVIQKRSSMKDIQVAVQKVTDAYEFSKMLV